MGVSPASLVGSPKFPPHQSTGNGAHRGRVGAAARQSFELTFLREGRPDHRRVVCPVVWPTCGLRWIICMPTTTMTHMEWVTPHGVHRRQPAPNQPRRQANVRSRPGSPLESGTPPQSPFGQTGGGGGSTRRRRFRRRARYAVGDRLEISILRGPSAQT